MHMAAHHILLLSLKVWSFIKLNLKSNNNLNNEPAKVEAT